MIWEIEGTDEFASWYGGLDENDRARIDDRVDLLAATGPTLGRPVVDVIVASKHKKMKELRSGTIRVLFIFDEESTAILLLGGDKQGNWTDWYTVNIPIADALYDTYRSERNQEKQEEASHGQHHEVQRDPGPQARQR